MWLINYLNLFLSSYRTFIFVSKKVYKQNISVYIHPWWTNLKNFVFFLLYLKNTHKTRKINKYLQNKVKTILYSLRAECTGKYNLNSAGNSSSEYKRSQK